ncbi:MAG TPA: hypothetical protein VGI30_03970 [Caulobacteraceae bacterium]|jgi:hypothetical protein
MKRIILASLGVVAAACATPTLAQIRLACPIRAHAAANVYGSARDTVARARAADDYARFAAAEVAYRRSLKAAGPEVAYDAMYGPGAYAQNFGLPAHSF